MNDLFIYLFRENNGEAEYVVLSDQNLTKDECEEHEIYGYHFELKISASTNDATYQLPFETPLIKQN